jgi:hypothetical protein
MGASVISPIPNPYSIKSKPLLPDKDKKLKLRKKSKFTYHYNYQVMWAYRVYPYVINVIRILSEHFSQKVALIGLSLNLLIKGF